MDFVQGGATWAEPTPGPHSRVGDRYLTTTHSTPGVRLDGSVFQKYVQLASRMCGDDGAPGIVLAVMMCARLPCLMVGRRPIATFNGYPDVMQVDGGCTEAVSLTA